MSAFIWDSAEIPAKIYFKIIETNDLSLLAGNLTSNEKRRGLKLSMKILRFQRILKLSSIWIGNARLNT